MAGEVTSTTITPHPTVSVLVEAPGYVSITKKIPLKHRFTHPDFPEPALRNDVVVQMLPTGITVTNIPSDVLETQASTVEVRGMVRGLGAITSLSYTFRGSTRSIALNANNQFQLDLRLPVTSDQTAYLLQLKAVDSLGPALEAQKVIIYVPEFAPDEVVVQFYPGVTQTDINRIVDKLNGTITDGLPSIKLYQINLPKRSRSNVLNTIDKLRNDNEYNQFVVNTLPNFYFLDSQDKVPNDLYYNDRKAGVDFRQTTSFSKIQMEEAWGITTGTKPAEKGIIVAVIDGDGVDWTHPDLGANIWNNLGEDADEDGHTIEFDPDNDRWIMDPDDINGIDDDKNGYVDDLIGWNFCEKNNNKTDPNDPSPDPISTKNPNNFHGTLIAGIIGAVSNNNRGVAGINWGVKIIPIKKCPSPGYSIEDDEESSLFQAGSQGVTLKASGELFKTIKAFAYASSMNAQIINASFGSFLRANDASQKANFKALQEIMDRINDPSVLYVFSAGNDALNLNRVDGVIDCTQYDYKSEKVSKITSLGNCLRFPQHIAMPNKILVAASDSYDTSDNFIGKSAFSNYGVQEVEIAAPGRKIYNTAPPTINGSEHCVKIGSPKEPGKKFYLYCRVTGTSFAAPMVAGAASLVLAHYPSLRGQPTLLKQRLLDTADLLNGVDSYRDITPYVQEGRRLNVFKAVGGDTDEMDNDRHPLPTIPTLTLSTQKLWRITTPSPTLEYAQDKHLIACDIDNDNDQDIIILTGKNIYRTAGDDLLTSESILLVNDGKGKFTDETHSRMNIGKQDLIGGDCGDVDGDGDNDLILASFLAFRSKRHVAENKNILLINDGEGVFHKAPDSSLPNIYDNSRDADFVDIDNDNDLDIFVANSIDQQERINGSLTRRGRSNVILLNNKNLNNKNVFFSDASDRLPKENTASGAGNGSSHNAHIVDINKDGCPDIYVANQMPGNFVPHVIDQFFINHKDSKLENCGDHFTDEALSLGILAGRNQGRDSSKDMVNDGQSSDLLERTDSAHEVAFADIDGDGDQDLIIARRQKETNLIYINNFIQNGKKNKTVSFSNESHRLSPNPRLSTSTLDVGDLTGDGCPDIIFGNGDLNTFEAYQDQMYVNTKNNDGECTGEFIETGENNGIPRFTSTTKHILFFDADNDHDLDVWFGNYGERDLFFFNTIH